MTDTKIQPRHPLSDKLKDSIDAYAREPIDIPGSIQLQDIPSAKSELLANLSHELRTPINAIVGLTNILAASQPLSDKQRLYVNTLQTSADTLLALIDNLLDISRIEGRSVLLESIPFDTLNARLAVGEDTKPPEARQEEDAPHDPKIPKILVVEDFEPNALVVTAFLDDFGYSYDIVPNGNAALEKIRSSGYFAILMDVQMAGMNGFQTTESIRTFEKDTAANRITSSA